MAEKCHPPTIPCDSSATRRTSGGGYQGNQPTEDRVTGHLKLCLHLTSFSPFLLPAATKLGLGNVFTGVCDSVHGGGVCLSACWDARPPQTRHTAPPDQAHHPPGPGTPPPPPTRHNPPPQTRHTTPPDQAHHHPGPGTPPPSPPPREADTSIRSMSGRYASYWNAFLFSIVFVVTG